MLVLVLTIWVEMVSEFVLMSVYMLGFKFVLGVYMSVSKLVLGVYILGFRFVLGM